MLSFNNFSNITNILQNYQEKQKRTSLNDDNYQIVHSSFLDVFTQIRQNESAVIQDSYNLNLQQEDKNTFEEYKPDNVQNPLANPSENNKNKNLSVNNNHEEKMHSPDDPDNHSEYIDQKDHNLDSANHKDNIDIKNKKTVIPADKEINDKNDIAEKIIGKLYNPLNNALKTKDRSELKRALESIIEDKELKNIILEKMKTNTEKTVIPSLKTLTDRIRQTVRTITEIPFEQEFNKIKAFLLDLLKKLDKPQKTALSQNVISEKTMTMIKTESLMVPQLNEKSLEENNIHNDLSKKKLIKVKGKLRQPRDQVLGKNNSEQNLNINKIDSVELTQNPEILNKISNNPQKSGDIIPNTQWSIQDGQNDFQVPKSFNQLISNRAEVFNQIIKSGKLAQQNGQSNLTLRLDPPSLGKMFLKCIFAEGDLTGKIVVESESVKHYLDQNLDTLKEYLAENNVTVKEFSVSVSEDNMANNREHQEQNPQVLGQKTKDYESNMHDIVSGFGRNAEIRTEVNLVA